MLWSRKASVRPKTALVFGSGGARGWAHIGALRALHDIGFAPDLVVGTSIGAVAAAVCATGGLAAAERLAEDLDWRRAATLFFELGLPKSGLVEGRRVMELLRELLPEDRIDRLPIPYAAVATDLRSQREVVLASDGLHDAIRASISIPGVFTPVRRDGQWLVDGGLVNPLPVSVARAMGATQVVAIDINLLEGDATHRAQTRGRRTEHGKGASRTTWLHGEPQESTEPSHDSDPEGEQRTLRSVLEGLLGLADSRRRDAPPALLEVVVRSLRAGENAITRERLLREPPDLLIQPAVGHIGTLEFHRSAAAIESGYAAAMAHAEALAALGESARRTAKG